MESALAWIGRIFDWIGQWIPRWGIVLPTHELIKFEGFFLPAKLRRFKGRMRITKISAGLFWYWPATTRIDDYPVVYQSDNLPSQTFETSDAVTITVGGIISYTVCDVGRLLTRNHSAQRTIEVCALTAIHQVCCRMTLDQLRDEQRRRTLGTKLKNEAQNALDEWGVVVEECRLTDLARTRAYRLIQSTHADHQG